MEERELREREAAPESVCGAAGLRNEPGSGLCPAAVTQVISECWHPGSAGAGRGRSHKPQTLPGPQGGEGQRAGL